MKWLIALMLMSSLWLSGCVGMKPTQGELLPIVAATPVVAQQQWRVSYRGVDYPLIVVAERRAMGYQLVIMNNLGIRLATIEQAHEQSPWLETSFAHPLDKQWLRLLQAYQWAFWPRQSVTQVVGDALQMTETGNRRLSSDIVQALVTYDSGLSDEEVAERWAGDVVIQSPLFRVSIQSVVVSN